MQVTMETVVRLSGEHARRLGYLATLRGVTEEELVAAALDALFRQYVVPEEEVDDAELLRRIEAEHGPLPPRQVRPALLSEEIAAVIPVPLSPELILRTEENH